MHDERPGDSKDICRVIRTEFLILGDDGDAFALKEMAECSLEQCGSLERQSNDLIRTRLAADPDLDLVALAKPSEGLARLAVLDREFDELQDVVVMMEDLSKPNIRPGLPN